MSSDHDNPTSHDKPCSMCGTPRSVLVRCKIDESGRWNFVCPGACWRSVSGGVEDAKGLEARYPHYRYGGMWKNRHPDGALSAKKPRKVKRRQKAEAAARDARASQDDNEVAVVTSSGDSSRVGEDDPALES